MSKPTVFLDRDGVINVDHGYVHTVSEFEFIPGVLEAAAKLTAAGYRLVVVTNQSGIARGYYTEGQFQRLTEWMVEQFKEAGACIEHVYHCPHHPEGQVASFAVNCDCRKPAPGMFYQANKDLNIELSEAMMVGDKGDDMRAAQNAGLKLCFLVKSGKPVSTESVELADYVVESFAELPALLNKLFISK
ncbi:D-glycero-beta-D-manno-heptose 1,7-bisphosphate 7-phosphatase [Corallincola luteus]|uniref:D,D-heptose 1,7-bisphosphate phosphatase n=1 Tax=Corallincola luteus TaxID=1775177 RepID=A0ABY2AGE3_9GAMM|nr:D-glycero-beta-D-manno-heptose 1,7-bisphosphate 7-phosphatase [Corallincola luteus]TCI01604.1 D-glycero-beta-D-manno-heptose 1,7-bisphosphate 7-phosphatase [Corallincola luteus]